MMLDLNWKLTALAAGGAVLAGVFLWLVLSRAQLRVDLAAVEAEARVCAAANADWEAKARTFQEAMDKMKTETAAREEKAALAQKAAQKKAFVYERHATQLLRQTAKDKDRCAAALALAQDYAKERTCGE